MEFSHSLWDQKRESTARLPMLLSWNGLCSLSSCSNVSVTRFKGYPEEHARELKYIRFQRHRILFPQWLSPLQDISQTFLHSSRDSKRESTAPYFSLSSSSCSWGTAVGLCSLFSSPYLDVPLSQTTTFANHSA